MSICPMLANHPKLAIQKYLVTSYIGRQQTMTNWYTVKNLCKSWGHPPTIHMRAIAQTIMRQYKTTQNRGLLHSTVKPMLTSLSIELKECEALRQVDRCRLSSSGSLQIGMFMRTRGFIFELSVHARDDRLRDRILTLFSNFIYIELEQNCKVASQNMDTSREVIRYCRGGRRQWSDTLYQPEGGPCHFMADFSCYNQESEDIEHRLLGGEHGDARL